MNTYQLNPWLSGDPIPVHTSIPIMSNKYDSDTIIIILYISVYEFKGKRNKCTNGYRKAIAYRERQHNIIIINYTCMNINNIHMKNVEEEL